MKTSFIVNYEQKLRLFEKKLERLILQLLFKKKIHTTFEINNYLKLHFSEFKHLYQKHRAKAWYRTRKILEDLEKEGIVKKEIGTNTKGKFRFLAHKWSLINPQKAKELLEEAKQKVEELIEK